jgi:transposase
MAAQAGTTSATLRDLRAERDRARAEYLAASRMLPPDTAERGRLWRELLEANAAYIRAKGQTR